MLTASEHDGNGLHYPSDVLAFRRRLCFRFKDSASEEFIHVRQM